MRIDASWTLKADFLLLAISSLYMRMPPEMQKEKKSESRMNLSCSIASTNRWKPACSLLAKQLHTTCWVLSRECGQQVTGELMKCQSGGREIACITYPQGALVVFSRISHTRGNYIILQQGRIYNGKKKEARCVFFNSSSNLCCSPVEIRAIIWFLPRCPRHFHIL